MIESCVVNLAFVRFCIHVRRPLEKPPMNPIHTTALILLISILQAQSAVAALVAHEGFDYPDGAEIVSQNVGTGFSSSWSGDSGFYSAISPGLSFGHLVTTGNATGLTTSQPDDRSISRSVSASAATLYLSFLAQPTGTLNAGAFNGFFGLQVNTASDDFFLGKPGGNAISEWVIEQPGGNNQVSTGVSAVVNQTTFLVLRIDYAAMGTDMLTMHVDPPPGQPEPATGTVNSFLNVGDLERDHFVFLWCTCVGRNPYRDDVFVRDASAGTLSLRLFDVGRSRRSGCQTAE